ncbi:SDR family NAD(P)-dependent oxidoreductase [Sulfidibacter corallicola]|uniref:SDR family NAD(P)-dependent oxidoreductase n=1 Tax=Sulfidibacter corallicola TaxID=2818388 RepID=A0A8A4TXE1_SULCO|nr:type I polyketide synthase [Sulfidibacter corallicola]QTD53881.1 SDR family NAD(P)-dependent oxidoreductase [Sulfidibacter corallicola]
MSSNESSSPSSQPSEPGPEPSHPKPSNDHAKFPPIAVVGVSALFPGSQDKEGFWRDILSGKDLITDVPSSHWLVEDYYDPDPSVPDKTYAKRGAFLPDVVFDPMTWGVPPSLVPYTDTAQLIALIVARQVLEDAANGQFESMDRSRISVILGATGGQTLMGEMVARLQRPVWIKALREAGLPESRVQEIAESIGSNYTDWKEATFPGLLGNVIAGRIANRLNLGGTNCVTDAACASSLSAVSMAVNELRAGQSDLVITGGVDTMNDIFMFMCFSKTPALSASGDCRPFSDQADGTMLGEGIGMVALKRLADAERDGDRIYAVLRGVGSSSDGRSKSVYAPVSAGQAQALRRAYEEAGFGAETVELVEAHGTGTKAGDAAEFGGLCMVFNETERESRQWCALGSVKSQIGHTKAAAGAAGLFKSVMALHHKVLPPTIKVDRPNPKLELEQSPFYLNTEKRPWVRRPDHPRRAGISSFGFGGSNFHLALEEYTGAELRAPRLRQVPDEWVFFGAETPAQLATTVEAELGNLDTPGYLSFLARRSQEGMTRSETRLAVVAKDEADLREKLNKALTHVRQNPEKPLHSADGLHYEKGEALGPVAFLFPGQGSQYPGMGADLAMNFEEAMAVWDRSAHHPLADGKALHEAVFPIPEFNDEARKAREAYLTRTNVAQPAIGAASLSMLALLEQAEIVPSASAGHSFGEVMALHAAGSLDEESVLAIARERGKLMAEAAKLPGAMIAVSSTIDEVRKVIESEKLEVVVANHNAPKQVVLAGTEEAVAQAESHFKRAGMRPKRLTVATAFHSEIVAASTEPLAAFLESHDFKAPHIPVYGNSEASEYPSEPSQMRRLLAQQLAKPVRFVEQIEAMYEAGIRVFLEVGPASVLTSLVGRILEGRPHLAISLDRKGRNGVTHWHRALARLAAAGVSMKPAALWSDFEDRPNPRDAAAPKVAIEINGANYNKPYPPPGGAAGLPKPNPEEVPAPKEVRPVAKVEPVAPAPKPAAPSAQSRPEPPRSPAAASEANLAMTQNPTTPAFSNPQPKRPARTQPSPAPAPRQAAPSAAMNAWLAAYSDVQQQTAHAHETYQQTMADTHLAYLQTAEQALHSLVAMAGGSSVQAQAGTARPAFAPAPVAAQSMPSLQPKAVDAPPAPVVPSIEPALPVEPPRAARPAVPETTSAPVAVTPSPKAAPAKPVTPKPEPKPQAVAAANGGVSDLLLRVVADKTGYPQEMLRLDMDLEADLGVDSIKRVEILSAMREAEPNLPEVDPSEMAALQTLAQITAYLGDTGTQAAPAAVAPSAPAMASAAPATDVHGLLLGVVAEKTGYPVEMLNQEMDLEADLGVDSIKRVEILSAMREAEPNLPEVDPSEMAELRTLGDITNYLSARLPQAPAAPAPTGSAPSASGLHDLLMRVVSEKTGYPADMLNAEMDLEADLGVDSIKRVEILSAMREAEPNLPEVDPGEMAELRTLGDIAGYMGRQMPQTTVASAPVSAPGIQVESLLIAVIAEKTGYPADMLNLDMDLEADLGVDSIKRVEILSAMREAEPNLPEVDPAEMAELRTLAQILEYMSGNLPAQAAPAPTAPAAAGSDLKGLMLTVIADKTGYPADMLNLDMDLEADLGVDSIKRVEILSAMRDAEPNLPEVDPAEMAELRTLAQIVDYMGGSQAQPAATPAPMEVAAPATPAVKAAPSVTLLPELAQPEPVEVGRFILRAKETPAAGMAMAELRDCRNLVITRDGLGVAEALAAALEARGIGAKAVDEVPADADGLIFLGGLRETADEHTAIEVNREAFRALKAAPKLCKGGILVTVQDTGGDFGLSGAERKRAWLGGLTGLVKTAAIEWNRTECKAIDLERADRNPEELAKALLEELLNGGPSHEVGLRADGTRLTLVSHEATVETGAPLLDDSSVVVATGGGRGVTAKTLIALAEATQARFVLLGRTALEVEPEEAAGIRDDAGLKKALLKAATGRGETLSPVDLNRRVQRILANREIRETEREIRIAGGQARYLAVDVLDEQALTTALDEVRGEWGPITALVHGAGVLADKLIAEKTEDQFNRVFDTKVLGLQRLLAATASDPLKALVLFSSVAGRCGNQGQCDYAMANEVLNKVADAERAHRGILVKSFNWGPWESGMVSPALKAHFQKAGIPIIGLEEGARFMVEELQSGSPDEVEITIGGEPRVATSLMGGVDRDLRLELAVDAGSYPFLVDHSIRGVPVAPVVMVLEWFARAARSFRPNLKLAEVRDVRVVSGIRLDRYTNGGNRFHVICRQTANGSGCTLALELRGENDRLHYSATAEMRPSLDKPSTLDAPANLQGWDAPIYDGEVLFHGPEFQVIRSLEGVSEEGIAGELVGTATKGWHGGWRTDVAALDGGLQLALLWGKHKLGGATLPTSVGTLKTYSDELPSGAMKALLRSRAVGANKAIHDIVFEDGGHVVAEMRDVETHLLPS